jgi:TatD DNase family protein
VVCTDSHAHLSLVAEELGGDTLDGILEDYAEALVDALREGRETPLLLDPGVAPGDLEPRIRLIGERLRAFSGKKGLRGAAPYLRLAAGIWPSAEYLSSPATSLGVLEASIAAAARSGSEIAAIGEGGLDYHHMEASKEAQAELFEGQLDLAARLGLPMIVHSRKAADDTLAIIAHYRTSKPVIIHCFGYGLDEAKAFLDLGCHISFAGNLTYKGSEGLREACAIVPEDRILLETDSPYMNPMPRRGKPASPSDIERTYSLAADLRGVSVEALAERVARNAHALFG